MNADFVVIGSGVGGGAVALKLAPAGARVRILERGERLPNEPQNSDAEAVFVERRYRAKERWSDGAGRSFVPGQYYYVGGHTKFYGTAMFRFRERDFEAVEHEDGVSPAWPIRYADLEPWYAEAERLFHVHGQAGADPTEPPRSTPYPYPAVPHEALIGTLAGRLRGLGLQPFPMPSAIDLRDGGRCVRCGTCDAFACRYGAKGDAEVCLIEPALRHRNVTLETGCRVRRLLAEGRRIVAAEVVQHGEAKTIRGERFVLSAGAINSALLLQRSRLHDPSDSIGRHYMNHNTTCLMGLLPFDVNATRFPKTLALNDDYDDGGNLQMLGNIQEPMVRSAVPSMPRWAGRLLTRHSVDWLVMSEDLPHRDSTVRPLADGGVELRWQRTNMAAHARFVALTKERLRRIGMKAVLSRPFGIDVPSHQCGTVRMGDDPGTSALDPWCRHWQYDNLWVVDASFFPSSAALNPALTVAAQALRVGARLAAG